MQTHKPIQCIAVDDEPPALKLIEKYIRSIPMLDLKGTCGNGVDALALLQQHHVDLMFMDIQMPQILGTDFIRSLPDAPKVIFTTAFRKFAVEGFDLDAVDYLLKPISFERFLKAVNKAMKMNLSAGDKSTTAGKTEKETSKNFLYLRADRKNIKVDFEELLFIESLKNYIKVVTKNSTIVTKYAISMLEEDLPESFIRIHRSYIVASGKIDSFNADFVQIGKYELPISRSYRHVVEKYLNDMKDR